MLSRTGPWSCQYTQFYVSLSLQTALPSSSCPHKRAAFETSKQNATTFQSFTILNIDMKDTSFTEKKTPPPSRLIQIIKHPRGCYLSP